MSEANATVTSPRSRWASLAVLSSGLLMTVIDGNIVTVAMPAIQSDLGFSAPGLAWVVNAYLIAFGGLLLLAGRLGDLIGRKRMFVWGLAVFTAASVLCGVASDQGLLIAARAVQGVGGAMTSAVVLGMLVALFPEPREQAKAIAVFSAVGAAGGAIGTFLGGALTETLNWHWIFLINLPIGVIALVAALRVLANDRGTGLAGGADYPGAALITGALMLTVYTIVSSAEHGTPVTLALAALSLSLYAAFAVRQSRTARPLLRLRLFRSRVLTGANAVQILMIAGMFGFQYIGALYFQRVLGYGELKTGFAFLPAPIAIGVLMLGLSAKVIGRFGPYRSVLGGLVLITAGLALLGRLPADGSYVIDVLPAMLLLGAGFAAAMPAVTGLAMSGAREEDTGLASGLFNTTQVVGGSLGLAILTTLAASRTEGLLADGEQTVAATADGYRLAFWVATGIAAAGLALAATVLRPKREPAAGAAATAATTAAREHRALAPRPARPLRSGQS